MGVLDGVGYHRREGLVLCVNLGHPIVISGNLLHTCAEVHEPVKLSFGVVSGVGPGIDVLRGGPRG